MKGFDRERLSRLAAELENALGASPDRAAAALRQSLAPLFERIAAGDVDRAVRVPGARAFMESDLPEMPEISTLWVSFSQVAEGMDTERLLAFSEACRRAAVSDVHGSQTREGRDVAAARAYLLAPERLATLEGARARCRNGEDLLDEIFGTARVGLVHLGTTLCPDGAQSRAYAIHGEAGFLMDLAPDGTCLRLEPEIETAGFMRLSGSIETKSLPERHAAAVDVSSWREAFEHVRSCGSTVLTIREHYDANPRVVFVCEGPPEMLSARSNEPAAATPPPIERFTRTYRIRNRRILHVDCPSDSGVAVEPTVPGGERGEPKPTVSSSARLRSSSRVTVLRTLAVVLPAVAVVVGLGVAGMAATGNLGVGIFALVVGFPVAYIAAVSFARRWDFARDAANAWVRLEGQLLVVPVDGVERRIPLAQVKAGGGYYWQHARTIPSGTIGTSLLTARRGVFLHLRAQGLELLLHARDGAADAPSLGLRRYQDPPEGLPELRVWSRELVPLVAALVRDRQQ